MESCGLQCAGLTRAETLRAITRAVTEAGGGKAGESKGGEGKGGHGKAGVCYADSELATRQRSSLLRWRSAFARRFGVRLEGPSPQAQWARLLVHAHLLPLEAMLQLEPPTASVACAAVGALRLRGDEDDDQQSKGQGVWVRCGEAGEGEGEGGGEGGGDASLSLEEIKQLLTQRGILFDADAPREDLINLLSLRSVLPSVLPEMPAYPAPSPPFSGSGGGVHVEEAWLSGEALHDVRDAAWRVLRGRRAALEFSDEGGVSSTDLMRLQPTAGNFSDDGPAAPEIWPPAPLVEVARLLERMRLELSAHAGEALEEAAEMRVLCVHADERPGSLPMAIKWEEQSRASLPTFAKSWAAGMNATDIATPNEDLSSLPRAGAAAVKSVGGKRAALGLLLFLPTDGFEPASDGGGISVSALTNAADEAREVRARPGTLVLIDGMAAARAKLLPRRQGFACVACTFFIAR